MPSPTSDAAEIDINDQPGHLIRRAHQIAVSVFHEKLGRDITPVQYAILRTLQKKPGIDQVTLAQQVALDTSTAADIAARLETKGWITRQVLARGQRELRLTAEGTGLLVPYDESDPEAFEAGLADAVNRVAGDSALARRMGLAGRERAVNEFGWGAIAARTVQLYNSLL